MSGLFTNFRTIPNLQITDTTASTSPTTGALVIAGGIGVSGNINIGGSITTTGTIAAGSFLVAPIATALNTTGTNVAGSSFTIRGGLGTGNAVPGNIIFSTGDVGSSSSASHVATEKMRLSSGGNLLIGSTIDNNADKLQVVGSIRANLATDSTVFSISQNSGARTFSFGTDGLICNTTAVLGKNTRNGSTLLEISTVIPSFVGVLIQGVSSQSADLQQWRDSNNNILSRIDNLGRITTPQLRLSALNTPPASATDIGTTGEIRIDANFFYLCVATNSWKRAALSAW